MALGIPRFPLPVRKEPLGLPCDLTTWLSLPEVGEEVTGYLLFTKDPRIFMIVNYPEDKQNMGLSINGEYPLNSHPTQASPHDHSLLRLDPQAPSPPWPPIAPLESSSAPLLPQTADKPVATQEQMREFYETITCMGMDKSEIMYADEKKVSAQRSGPCPPEGAPTEVRDPAFKCPPDCKDS